MHCESVLPIPSSPAIRAARRGLLSRLSPRALESKPRAYFARHCNGRHGWRGSRPGCGRSAQCRGTRPLRSGHYEHSVGQAARYLRRAAGRQSDDAVSAAADCVCLPTRCLMHGMHMSSRVGQCPRARPAPPPQGARPAARAGHASTINACMLSPCPPHHRRPRRRPFLGLSCGQPLLAALPLPCPIPHPPSHMPDCLAWPGLLLAAADAGTRRSPCMLRRINGRSTR